ncbi:MAG: hypothetical protein HYZ57_01195 [Acidobacteria bacterium]|nr:hypothetical protein [Acidobacteriota bacterium]
MRQYPANFVIVVLPGEEQAARLFNDPLREGVIIRPLKATGLPHCVRISAGAMEENEFCVDCVKRVMPLALAS